MLPHQHQQLHPPPRVQSQQPYTIVYQNTQRTHQQQPTVFALISFSAATTNSPLQSLSISSSCASSPQLSMTSSSGGNIVDLPQQQGAVATMVPTNPQDPNRLLLKCAHFFKSLSRFKPNSSQEQHRQVLQLLREGVTSEMSAEEFSAKLREVTGSQDKGNLLPFLKLSLPLLRVSIRKGEQSELQQMLRLGSAECDSPDETSLPSPQQQQLDGDIEEAITEQRQQQISRSVPPPSLQQIQTGQIVNVVRPLSVQNSLNAPCSATTSTTFVVHRKPPTPQHQLQRQTHTTATSPVQQVQAVIQQPQKQLNHSPSASSSVATTNVHETTSTSITTIAQAQLAPENLQNLPPMLLNPQALADRILIHMPDAQGVDAEVLSIISMAAEARLRSVLANLAALADHRQRPLRVDPHYALVDEPRKQMRFMEDIERRAHESRETAEKEAMMRTAKSKGGKDRDVVEKAKMIQKADREAMVNHEANLAAFAALGVTKTGGPMKRPFGAPNGPGSGADWKSGMQNQGTSGGLVKDRPPVVRLKRVTMRDLQYFLCNDPLVPSSSRLRYRIALSTLSVDENNTTNI